MNAELNASLDCVRSRPCAPSICVAHVRNAAVLWVQDLYRVVQGIDVFDPKFNIVYALCRRMSPSSPLPA